MRTTCPGPEGMAAVIVCVQRCSVEELDVLWRLEVVFKNISLSSIGHFLCYFLQIDYLKI